MAKAVESESPGPGKGAWIVLLIAK